MTPTKTILIATTTFFPHPVVGAVRMTQLCRHLPEFGFKPVVLCRHYGYQATPAQLAHHVHPAVDLRYYDAPANSADTSNTTDLNPLPREPSLEHRYSIGRWSRKFFRQHLTGICKQFFVPDVSRPFWRRARAATQAALDEVSPDIVLTSGPPHSNHDLGRWLSHHYPMLPWVADFRDPYLLDVRFRPHGLGKLFTAYHGQFEATVYQRAALITHAIPLQARWARHRYRTAREKIKILTNGCPSELAERKIELHHPSTSVRRIVAMGAQNHNLRSQLVRAAQQLALEGESLEVRLIGPTGPHDDRLVSASAVPVVATGPLPHHEALAELLAGDVLLGVLSHYRSSYLGLSSKLFEFLACGKPVIVVNPTRPDRQLLRPFNGVRTLKNPTDAQLAQTLRWSLSATAIPPAEQTVQVCRKFSRRAQAKALAGWLDRLL